MKKLVVHVFHADPDSLSTSAHVSERIRQVAADRGVQLEVFLFGPAEAALLDAAAAEYNATIDDLARQGVAVFTCLNTARDLGAEATFAARGIQTAFARDKFVEYAADDATVISF